MGSAYKARAWEVRWAYSRKCLTGGQNSESTEKMANEARVGGSHGQNYKKRSRRGSQSMWNYEKLLKKQLRQKLLDYMAKLKQEAEGAVKAA